MSAKPNVFTLVSKPGIKRDGTNLDSDYYQDGQWVRFQRGRPKKIGGYRAMSTVLSGPVRNLYVDSRAGGNTAHSFSAWGVEQLAFNNIGAGAGLVDRTPAGLAYAPQANWQSDAMFNNGGGGAPVLVCAQAPDLDSLSSDATGGVYSGTINATTPLTQISDGSGPIMVSGGCVVLQPFLFLYGSNGLIRNSNANDFSVGTGWSGVNANTGNFSDSKVVKGLPIRGGYASPAGLFWALDSLIRVSYIGGTALWRYDPMGAITVLSKSAIVEYDGIFYWPGADRFYGYTGVIQEVPNAMSHNFFYDNLNYTQAQKIWALKVPRYGEIWWFYPSGSSAECNQAIIYNVREQTWYDAALVRSAGFAAQVFHYPVMAGGEPLSTVRLPVSAFLLPAVLNTLTPSTTGGTLAAATYYYVVTALNAAGETTRSNELSTATTGATSSVTVAWAAVTGATGYRVYRGTAAGAEGTFYTVGAVTSFADTGAAGTAGTSPVTNTAAGGAFAPGNMITGVTSGATGTLQRIPPSALNVVSAVGTFLSGEVVQSAAGSSAYLTGPPTAQELDVLWQHESGYDRVNGTSVTAIQSYFETNNFQWASGGPVDETGQGIANQVRLTRVEPDFISVGTINLTVRGAAYAQSVQVNSAPYPFNATTEYLAVREQRRQISLRFESNEVGGYYEGGKVFMTVELGDERP